MADKKIAILGGSFNPVHFGHVSLARNVVEAGMADEVWLSLSPLNPFKDANTLMDTGRRLQMLEDALKDEPAVHWTDVELTMPTPSYTIDALDRLSSQNPHCSFTLIIGADNLARFTRWKDWDKIIEKYGLIVYPRGKEEMELPVELRPYRARITLMADAPLYDISSTRIRQQQNPSNT